MKIGMMNNPRFSVYDEITAIGEAGLDFVDLTIEGPTLDVDPQKATECLESHGLFAVGHTDPCLPYAYPVGSVEKACFKELERCASTFTAIGVQIMNIHPCYASPPSLKQDLVKQNIRALKPISRMVQDYGLVPVLENFKAPFDRVSTFERLFSEIPELYLHLDFGHSHLGKDDGPTFCKYLGQRLRHVHFSDNRASEDDHMPLGAGTIDWNQEVAALKDIGYDDTITLEIFCGSSDVLYSYINVSKRFLHKLWGK